MDTALISNKFYKKIVKKYFIGTSLPHKWASVYDYRPQSQEILEKKGEIFAVVSLIAPKKFNSITAGSLLLDNFHEAYFESKKDSVIAALRVAFTATQDRLRELLNNEEEVASEGVDLDISAMVLRGNEVYFAVLGDAKIYLLPGKNLDEVIDITKALRDPYGQELIRVGSSFSSADQRYALISASASKEIGAEAVKDSLKNIDERIFHDYDFLKPETASAFLIAIDPLAEIEESNLTEQIIQTQENIQTQQDSQTLETNLQFSDGAEEFTQDTSGTGIEDGLMEEYNTDMFGENVLQSNLENELTDNRENETSPEASFSEKAKLRVQNLIAGAKSMISNIKERRKLSKLQMQRSRAAENPGRTGNFGMESQNSEQINENDSTVTGFLKLIRMRLMGIKDYLLYDLLKVNHGNVFSPDKPAFRVMVFVGILLVVVAVLGVISNIGENQQRAATLQIAATELESIEARIAEFRLSPVLNRNSQNDISQRQALLVDVRQLESRFNSSLDVLDTERVAGVKASYQELYNSVVKLRNPVIDVFSDVANVKQAQVGGIVVMGDNLFVSSPDQGRIFRQPLTGGAIEDFASNLEGASAISKTSRDEIVVATTMTNPIKLVNQAGEVFNNSLTAEQTGAIKDLAIYELNNNLYSVAAGDDRLLQYTKVSNSFAVPTIRFRDASVIGAEDIEVNDGRIFILATGAGLIRVGLPNASIEAFPEITAGVRQASALAIDSTHIYIVDNVAKKLYTFTKYRDGQAVSVFTSQMDISSIPENVTTVAIAEAQNRILLGTQNRVYSVSRSAMLN